MEREVRIVDFPQTRVAALSYCGDPALLDATARRFAEWRRAAGLTPATHATFSVLHASPADPDFRHDLCVATDDPIPNNKIAVIEDVIPAARCAVVRLEAEKELGATLAWLYGEWMPLHGEGPSGRPPFVQRLDVTRGPTPADVFAPLA